MQTSDQDDGPSRADPPDYPSRLDEITTSLDALYDALNDQEEIETVLRRVADTTVRAVPDADVVTVTALVEGRLQRIATTDPRVSSLDQQQYDLVAGPYQEAAQQRRPVRATLEESTQCRWPEFANAATAAGVRACLSVPVFIETDPGQNGDNDGGELLGILNLYGDSSEAFDPFDEALLRLLSTTVSAAITSARRYDRTRTLVDNLQYALHSRSEIDQAKGVLMAVHSIDADAAFERLVRQSQHANTKLHTVARQLLDAV